jgi:hypothetical protein
MLLTAAVCFSHAGSVAVRYTADGFAGIYDDVMYLSSCDYIIGTFSSQVSRLAYEVSLANNTLGAPDRCLAYHSLDSMWCFGGMSGRTQCAATDFTVQGRVSVRAGQKLSCAAIHKFDRSSGYEKCKLFGSATVMYMPPGLVVDCPSKQSTFRQILPERMRGPAAAAAKATGASSRGAAFKWYGLTPQVTLQRCCLG